MIRGEDAVRKFKKKIKIRLLDSNDPNSYVCEIFDSSLEEDSILIVDDDNGDDDEENKKKSNKNLVPNNEHVNNYFEILMSKDLKKNRKNLASKENLSLTNKVGNKKLKKYLSSDSSDDESFYQVRQRCDTSNSFKISKGVDGFTGFATDNKNNSIKTSNEGDINSQKIKFLNYFSNSKVEEKKVKKIKETHQVIKSKKIKFIKENNSQYSENKTFIVNQEKKEGKTLHNLKKENIKLAPVFLIKERKALNLAIQKARYDFLHKETKLLKVVSDKNVENIDFQRTCHVQQRDNSALWSIRKIQFVQPESHPIYEFKIAKTFSANIIGSDCLLNNNKTDLEIINNKLVNVDGKLIRELKIKYSNLNLDNVINGLKSKKEKFQNLFNSVKQTKEVLKAKNSNNSESDNFLWKDKYKPSSYEILGNDEVVNKLRNWLQAWQKFDKELKYLSETSRKKNNNEISDDNDSEDDAFVESNAENFNLKPPGNVCIIFGPNSCGKTALVSSLADDLEFNVLEVNASSKRTGKKVITDFQEATQSHKVQHLGSSSSLKAFIGQQDKKKSGKKTKKVAKSFEEQNEKKISLILIEDADIIFEEHDEGFYSAVSFLVQTSKRPFIFVTDNPNCEQLENFKNDECLLLEMQKPPFDQACAVLNIVSNLEGAPIKKETAESLFFENNFDLRKSLLDLEFWNGSENGLKQNKSFDLGRLWWSLPKILSFEKGNNVHETVQYKRRRRDLLFVASDDEDGAVSKKAKVESKNEGFISSFLCSGLKSKKSNISLKSLFTMLDVTVTLDLIGTSLGDEPLPDLHYTPKSSLSLDENMETVHYGEDILREEISREIVEKLSKISAEFCKTEKTEMDGSFPCWDRIRWRNSMKETLDNLSHLVPQVNGRDNRNVHLDYIPFFRNICKIEKIRSSCNGKRKNRFSHYLNNFGAQISTKTLTASCQIFNR